MEMYVIAGVLVVGFAGLGFLLLRKERHSDPHLNAELERRREEIGELKSQYAQEKSKTDELSGKNKQLFAQLTKAESALEAKLKEIEKLTRETSRFQADADQARKDLEKEIKELSVARKKFEDEQLRVRQGDEERRLRELEERDRMWAEHEVQVVSYLTELCKQPEFTFSSFTNVNLPKGFHGTLKPDFMIEFLGQYIIFDAKVSKSSNLSQYIADQVKKTAQKIKGDTRIHPSVYLVVPAMAITELKKFIYYENGFNFFVVTPQSVAPILASLKRIEAYEFAKEMDPQERENIVDLVAHLNFHIATRNAIETYMIEHGVAAIEKIQSLNEELAKEIIVKREKMRHLNFNTADLKQLAANPTEVRQKLKELSKPSLDL